MRGLTLIELVVAMVLVAIIFGATIYFLYPLRQAVDVTARAELTDVADNALQRIAREVRLALPNSVRVTSTANSNFIEFLPVRTAGRYRAEPSGGKCDLGTDTAGSDELAFDVSDSCFKSIGIIANQASITANDFVVLNNFGPGFAGQNAYDDTGVLNRARISAAVEQGAARQRINLAAATTFVRSLHDSPGKRFYVVVGRPAAPSPLPEPVTFECNTTAQTLTRRWNYDIALAQPTVFGVGASSAALATGVTGCSFNYSASVAPQVGLLTLGLMLSRTLSDGGTETVSLYHAIHVTNVP